MNRKIRMKTLIFLLTAVTALSCAESPKIEYAPGQTVLMLDEYLAQDRKAWFLTGKKEHAVEAMMVSEEISFHNDLEVADYTVTDEATEIILSAGQMKKANPIFRMYGS